MHKKYRRKLIKKDGTLCIVWGQELLLEAGRTETAGGDSQVLSPETAARKRASALESRRFLTAMAEAEARKHAEDVGVGDDDGDDGDVESKMTRVSVRRGWCLFPRRVGDI